MGLSISHIMNYW